MTSRMARLSAYTILLCASSSCVSMALAQTAPDVPAPPVRSPVDENGINLATGALTIADPDVSIGGAGGLSYVRQWEKNGWRHSYVLTISETSTTATVSIGGQSFSFTKSGSAYVADQADGSTLTSTASTYTYTARDGTVVTFDRSVGLYYTPGLPATQIVLPTGEKLVLSYNTKTVVIYLPPPQPPVYQRFARLQSVNSSHGYQLKFEYANEGTGTLADWSMVTKVTGINNAVDYCDPLASTCAGLTQAWPNVTYAKSASGSNTLENVTDTLGRVTRYTTDSSYRIVAIKRPSSSTDNITIGYDSNSRVASVSNGQASWTYGWSPSGNIMTATITDPLAH